MNRFFIVAIFLMAILTLGCVSAADENQTDTVSDSAEVSQDNDFEMFFDDLPDEVKCGENVDFTVQFYTRGITGQIYLQVDNNRTEIYDVEGSTDNPVSFKINDFGNHTLHIKYMGNYPTVENSFDYTVTDYLLDVHPQNYQFLYGQESYLEVDTLDGMTGEVSVVIGNATYYLHKNSVDSFNSLIKLDSNVLNYGDVITVNYVSGPNDRFWSKSYNFTVNLDSEIIIPKYNWMYNVSQNVELYLPPQARGTLEVSVDGKKYASSRIVNGSVAIPVAIDDIGEHYISAEYMDDLGFNISSEYVKVLVSPKVNYNEKISINGSNISFEMPEKYTGKVSLYIEDWDFYDNLTFIGAGEIKNGSATVPLKLDEGDYYIVIRYDIGRIEDSWILISSIKDNPQWIMDISMSDFVLKENGQFIASIDNAHFMLKDNFTIKINGSEYPYEFDGYNFIVDTSSLDYGKYMAEFEFLGDEYFMKSNYNGYFNVVPVIIDIPQSVNIDLAEMIQILLPREATGKITATLNGKKIYEGTVKDDAYLFDNHNHVEIYLDDLKYGSYDVNVTYKGNLGTYSTSGKINVTYYFDTEDSVTYGDATLRLRLPSDLSSKVTITVDGIEYPVISKQGEFGINRYVELPSNLSVGNHTVKMSYDGDSRYPKRDLTKTFEVVTSIILRYADFDGYDGVTLMVPDDAKGNFEVYINGESYSSQSFNVSFDKLGFGKYNLLAKYTGSDYNVTDLKIEYTINPQWIYPSKMTYRANEYLSVDLGDVNGTLILTVDEIYLTKDLINGKACISLSGLPIGENFLSVQLNQIGKDGILINVFDDMLTVKVVNPIMASNVNVFYASGSLYKAKIVDVNGKALKGANVVFYINNKKVASSKTDKNGYASFKITQVPKTYNVKIAYGKASVVKKLNVKHVVSLKTVTVKKSAKKITLKATLKGKTYLKKKTVTFKFNGKTYKAKTNSKGLAKVTIKLKNLKVGKKITYQATYLKDTAKKTLKVKK